MLRSLLTKALRRGTGYPAPASRKLNLGCGRKPLQGWVNLDAVPLDGVEVVADLDDCRRRPLPFPDDSFDEFLAAHVIEHLREPLAFMQELHRIAAPGAKALFRLPYGSSDDAFEDPTHVRQYFLGSFHYFAQTTYWRADYGYRGDWDADRIVLLMPAARYAGKSADELLREVSTARNCVTEMHAHLRAVKPVRAPLDGPTHSAPVEFKLI
jgi:SAM-dependent methyltransferase